MKYVDAVRARIQPFLDRLSDAWDALPEERKQRLRPLLGATVVAVVMLAVVGPLLRGRLDARAELAAAKEQLDAMRRLENIVVERGLAERPESELKSKTKGKRGTSLLATVDGTARRLKIQPLVQSVRPVGSRGGGGSGDEAVEIQLKGLVLEELLKLLYELEIEHEDLAVRKLEISREIKAPRELRATLEVAQR